MNDPIDALRTLFKSHFPGLLIQESRSGNITTLSTVSKHPIGLRASIDDRNIVVEMAVSLGSSKPATTTGRVARGGSFDLLDQQLAQMRASLVAWWGCVGDALWTDGEPGDPGQPRGGAEGSHLQAEPVGEQPGVLLPDPK